MLSRHKYFIVTEPSNYIRGLQTLVLMLFEGTVSPWYCSWVEPQPNHVLSPCSTLWGPKLLVVCFRLVSLVDYSKGLCFYLRSGGNQKVKVPTTREHRSNISCENYPKSQSSLEGEAVKTYDKLQTFCEPSVYLSYAQVTRHKRGQRCTRSRHQEV